MKKCASCLQNKPLSEFHRERATKDGFYAYCKSCQLIANKKHRIKNIERYRMLARERVAKSRNKKKFLYCEFLSQHECIDCKENNILVLEPDHLENKRYNISTMLGGAMKWETVAEELAKCEIVCRNCHIIRTHKRTNSYRLKYLNGELI